MDIWEDDKEKKVQNDTARKTNLKHIMGWTFLHLSKRNYIKIIISKFFILKEILYTSALKNSTFWHV